MSDNISVEKQSKASPIVDQWKFIISNEVLGVFWIFFCRRLKNIQNESESILKQFWNDSAQ